MAFIKLGNKSLSLRKKIRQLRGSPFARNVAIVAMGSAGAQAVTMLFAPVITRQYGPEAFGLLGTFVAILAVLASLATLTYSNAIVLPKSDNDAKGIAHLSILIAIVVAVIATFLIIFWGDWIASLLDLASIRKFLFLIPIAILCTAAYQVAEQWLIRKKQFKSLARATLVQSLVLNLTKSGVGVFHPLAIVLIVLQTLASALHAFLLGLEARKNKAPSIGEPLQKYSLRDLAYRHRDFAFFRAPQATINVASQSLPVLMLAAYFGPATAGFYSLGRTIMGVPAGLIGKSVGDVFYPRISEAAQGGEKISSLVVKATLVMAAVGFAPFALVIAFGPWLFALVFGEDWTRAGEYGRWISLWLFFMFLNNPSVKAIPVIKAQGYHLVFTFVTVITRVLALYFGYYFYSSDLAAITLFGISGAILNMALITMVIFMCKRFDSRRC